MYGENYIEITPTGPTNPQQQGEATMFEVTCAGKVHRFQFDPSTDDPADGATLVGVRTCGSDDIHQLTPSQHAEPAAWDAANKHYGI